MSNIEANLRRRLAQLDPERTDRTDAISRASLQMLRLMLGLVEVSCEAEGLARDQIERILDRVIIGGLPSPGYHVLAADHANLTQAHIDLLSTTTSPIRP